MQVNNDFFVLSAIREADHAVSPRHLAPLLNLSPAEIYQSILSLEKYLRMHAYDKNSPEGDCRYYVAKEHRPEVNAEITAALHQMPENLYFAYGSNMDYYQLYRRCPNAHFVTRATLKNSTLSFPRKSATWNGSGVAGYRAEEGSELPGVVYYLPFGDFARLDSFEGHPNSYLKEAVTISTTDYGTLDVVSYKAVEQGEFFAPARRYMEQTITGARLFNLDPIYVQRLMRIPTAV